VVDSIGMMVSSGDCKPIGFVLGSPSSFHRKCYCRDLVDCTLGKSFLSLSSIVGNDKRKDPRKELSLQPKDWSYSARVRALVPIGSYTHTPPSVPSLSSSSATCARNSSHSLLSHSYALSATGGPAVFPTSVVASLKSRIDFAAPLIGEELGDLSGLCRGRSSL